MLKRKRRSRGSSVTEALTDLRERRQKARESLSSELGELRETLSRVESRVHELESQMGSELERVIEILQLVYAREPESRERLRHLRESPEYGAAYSEARPLVSVVIPTYDNYEQLRDRSLPSALGQTYSNIEVVIVGDCAPPETEAVIAAFNDSRISYHNFNRRGPYPEQTTGLWHVAGVPPRNEAVYRARGLWIAHLDDDDHFRPDHVERLLEAAVQERFEVCYGKMTCHLADGRQFEVGAFPPALGQFGWQAAIFHKGLSFFETELADALFGLPADWALCRRMLRTGVRFGMVEGAVTDYYSSATEPWL
jgi:Glycosyl transferase family 2